MAKKKKKVKKTRGGIAAYVRKINNAPRVKSKSRKISDLERKLARAKREKEKAVNEARRKYRRKYMC